MDGLRVGVTGARKGAELTQMLQRHGAAVLWGPTLQTLPPESDTLLVAATEEVLTAPPGWLVASTGTGMRAWVGTADATGRGKALREWLAVARSVARGAKAVGALRALGIRPVFVSPQETDADLAGWLTPRVGPAETVVVQAHGVDTGESYREVAEAGARLLRVTPYRCVPPEDRRPAQRLIRAAVDGELDVIVATSAPAVVNLFVLADDIGCRAALRAALRGPLAAAAVGLVTARAFEDVGVPVQVMPRRARSADLVRALDGWAERRRCGYLDAEPVPLRLAPDACVVRIEDRTVVLNQREFDVLAALVRRPGIVCPPELLIREAWGHQAPPDPSHVKHQISGIRRKLGQAGRAIQTVRSVGYRYDPAGQ